MPGGGHWGVSPGQVTDDGELTMCQLRGLLDYSKTSSPPLQLSANSSSISESKLVDPGTAESAFGKQKIDLLSNCLAGRYVGWMRSKPFDMGHATFAALGWASAHNDKGKLVSETAYAATCRANARKNEPSKANGQLMRSTPLAVFLWRCTDAEMIHSVCRADASLTHPNPTVIAVVTMYCLAIGHLIRHPDDIDGAIHCAVAFASQLPNKGEVCAGRMEAHGWLQEALAGKVEPFHPRAGFVKIAFTHAFYHLSRRTPWKAAMVELLSGGGDTDTNACIVSGLLGAAYGIHALPEEMVEKVLRCDTKATLTRQRPESVQPTRALPGEIEQLMLGGTCMNA